MRIRMLLGPAGSGKTFRCIDEIRNELSARPDGAPLIFLAPKQSTFQLERQLLARPDLSGYCRLNILSFQRLAHSVFAWARVPMPRVISNEGRVMVLRALLNTLHRNLTVFRASARRLGFAEEASHQIREFQQHGLTPTKIREVAGNLSGPVRDKLLDLALLFEEYSAWLRDNELADEDYLLTAAAEQLEAHPIHVAGVWLDGFAQLTPQERRLLASLIAGSERSLLAFCLDQAPESEFSAWFLISQTYRKVRGELATRFGAHVVDEEWLRTVHRFQNSPALSHLERHWGSGEPFQAETKAVRIMEAPDPEGEIAACAREILRFVRAGNRFREAAVLLRSFSGDYADQLRRVFARYEIPYFLDHRAGVAHHPLTELTRGALRIAVFNWKHQDCFTVFKTGLFSLNQNYIDDLENAALEYGWEGKAWQDGFRCYKENQSERERMLNEWRRKLIEPLLPFIHALGQSMTGAAFARGMRDFWSALNVEEKLTNADADPQQAIHATVWRQMSLWLDNVELAFARHPLALREWLSIVEAGLDGLTVGVVPPVLDQVLVGTVDRSRNPDLKAIFIVGLNEGVFPSPPVHNALLGESDRLSLMSCGCEVGNLPSLQLSQEQFYGYIALTRAREAAVLTYARSDSQGTALNPSRFIGHVQRLFPKLVIEYASPPASIPEVQHASELARIVPGGWEFKPYVPALPRVEVSIPAQPELPLFASTPPAYASAYPAALLKYLPNLPEPDPEEVLDPALARDLYGPELKIAISSMERYASCPYRFFLEKGLGLNERVEFRLDVREQGSFQHEVLSKFHEAVCERKIRWRDLSIDDAKGLIGMIADEEMHQFRGGLLLANEQNRFMAENYKSSLKEFIGLVIEWFATNKFDPVAVEFAFGESHELPGWRLLLANGCTLVLKGRVDRVDVFQQDGRALCMVMDYKSGNLRPDKTLMYHGIQQQLPAYLLAICKLPEVASHFGVSRLEPAGCFYVPLTPKYSTATRSKVLERKEVARKAAHKHYGVFDETHLDLLDASRASGQFHQPTRSGTFAALPPERFTELLERVETLGRKFGQEIYNGNIAIRPYKKGLETACSRCLHQAVCRFDPWEQDYNVLRDPEAQP